MKKKIRVFVLLIFFIGTNTILGQTIPTQTPNITDTNNKKQGDWVIWYNSQWEPTDILDSVMYYRKISFKNGVSHGITTDYYKSGIKQFEGNLISIGPDVIDGKCYWYYENGNKELEEFYKNNIRKGKSISFYENGIIKEVKTFSNDTVNGKYEAFYENGKKRTIGFIKSGEESGKWLYYYENGKIDTKVQFVNGKEHGKIEGFYESGSKELIGYYTDGSEMGRWVWYNEDESVKGEKNYGSKIEIIWENNNLRIKKMYRDGNYENAIIFAKSNLEYALKKFGTNNDNYNVSLNNLAILYEAIGQYDKALPLYIDVLKNREKLLGKEHPDYGISLNNLAVLYSNMGKYEEALPLSIKALENAEKSLGKENSSYGIRLNNLALLYKSIGQYEKALPLYLEALENVKNNFGNKSIEYAEVLFKLTRTYEFNKDFDSANYHYLELIEINNILLSKTDTEYLFTLDDYARFNLEYKKYQVAKEYFLICLEGYRIIYGVNSEREGWTLNNLGIVSLYIDELEEAEKYYIEALNIYNNIYINSHKEYILTLKNLIKLYRSNDDLAKAEIRIEEMYNILSMKDTVKTLDFADFLDDICLFYCQIGQYEKGIDIWGIGYNIRKVIAGEESIEVAKSLYKLGQIWLKEEFYKEASSLLYNAYIIAEKLLKPDDIELIKYLEGLAEAYRLNNDYELVLDIYLKLLKNFKEFYENNPFRDAIINNNIGSFWQDIGFFDKAESSFLFAYSIIEKEKIQDNEYLVSSLRNIISLYCDMNQFEKAEPYIIKAYSFISKRIKNNLCYYSESKSGDFLDNINLKLYYLNSFTVRYYIGQTRLSSEAYNIELIIKGIILQSGINMRQSILNSGNIEALQKFDEWMYLRKNFALQSVKLLEYRTFNLDSLEESIKKLETDIARLSTTFEQSQKNGSIKWKEIQSKLKIDEVAIEFTSFPYHNGKEWTDSALYIALVLNKQDSLPHLVPLFEQKQLDSLLLKNKSSDKTFINTLYRGATLLEGDEVVEKGNSGLYELIWKPIEHLIPQGSTVYFSPSGSLHQISFAAIAIDSNTRLCDNYKLVQLSTTAMLVQESPFKNEMPPSIELYGGINYDAESKELEELAQSLKKDNHIVSRSIPSDIDRGNVSWKYLPGTLKEVENINAVAKKYKVKTQFFTGKDALEEQIKSNKGNQSPRIIHIATHGFFFPDPKIEHKERLLIEEEERTVYRTSDNPLNRAGLLFAGANNTWLGKADTINIEDGILTAYEAANMTLGNTQLVVLSACETGLGDIKGSEGVYGLQRSFKAAGAEYVVMSLWKVPDAETAEFMEYFYEKLFSGKPIPEAFRLAQELMKNKYRSEPYKWGAFVLVR